MKYETFFIILLVLTAGQCSQNRFPRYSPPLEFDYQDEKGLELEAPRSTRSNLEFAVSAPVESTDIFPDVFDFYGYGGGSDNGPSSSNRNGEPKKQVSRLGMLLRSKKSRGEAEKRKLRNLLLRSRKSTMDNGKRMMENSEGNAATNSNGAGKSKDLKQVLASLALRN